MRANPGPLGYFFRRLQKRKPYSVAVVAVAHKLALLAWHLLSKGEPYRYAIPQTTKTKLQRLRVQATGQKHRTGPAPGKKPRVKLSGGSHITKPLTTVYQIEGVPAASPAPDGERRHLDELKLQTFVDSLQQERVIPRRTRKKPTADKAK
jgi:hypothetical protein